MGQTVNLLAYAFGGSNPSLPTIFERLGGLSRKRVQPDNAAKIKDFCGSSSVDRALAFQAEGRGFEPRLPLLSKVLADIC